MLDLFTDFATLFAEGVCIAAVLETKEIDALLVGPRFLVVQPYLGVQFLPEHAILLLQFGDFLPSIRKLLESHVKKGDLDTPFGADPPLSH